jgi:predicted NAD/FAD-binding protein
MANPTDDQSLRIAVVGGGVAGIVAAELLQRRHQVTLFEKNGYIGGHTHTVVIPDGPDAGTPVDTGFIVFNDRTYPILNRFLRHLNVAIAKSDMSFSYCCEKSGFEYASRSLDSLFAQRASLVDPTYWAMLGQILVFNRLVRAKLQRGELDDFTLGRFLRRFRFSPRFREQYLFPMVAAIWSAPDAAVEHFPMLSFARFFENHGLLALRHQPQWYYVAGGSHTYVRAFLKRFGGEVRTGAAVAAIRREADGVILQDAGGQNHRFDRVVIAAHADEALKMLADPSADERRLLGAWRYSTNQTFLHTDPRWMPANRRAWASWNVFRSARSDARSGVTLTYHMNRLQRLETRHPYLVTLNPFAPVAEERIVARMTYTHPTYTFESLATQPALPRLNGRRHTCFCGAYFGYGFHEDAARAGVEAAKALGADDAF